MTNIIDNLVTQNREHKGKPFAFDSDVATISDVVGKLYHERNDTSLHNHQKKALKEAAKRLEALLKE